MHVAVFVCLFIDLLVCPRIKKYCGEPVGSEIMGVSTLESAAYSLEKAERKLQSGKAA